jgi:hypothetical protein
MHPDPDTYTTPSPLEALTARIITLEQRILQLERRNEYRAEYRSLGIGQGNHAAIQTHHGRMTMTFTNLHPINPWTHWR